MPTDVGRTSEPDQLDGWKQIAAYLGRSVRAAQRWERDLGLPVRRLKTAGGQVVFAHCREIDAWKARVEVPIEGNGDALVDQVRERRDARPSGWALFVAAVVLFVLSAVMLIVTWSLHA